jgi:hypothetical protein
MKVKNLYKFARWKAVGCNKTNKKCPVGRKKVPSWKKICFQLENYFFPTRNPVLGGYWLLMLNLPFFPF